MPLYEYKCSQCGKTFEKLLKFSDAPLTVCALCQGGPITRVISTPAFHLKGGGWYKDGYGGAPVKTNGATESKSADGGTTPAAGSESKPAAKTESPSPSTPAPSTEKSSSSTDKK